MKKYIAVILLYLSVLSAQPQTILKCCIDADSDGACTSETSKFLISKEGGTVSFLLKNEKGLGTNHVVYRIFKVDDDDNENFRADIHQKMDSSRIFVWQDAVFHEAGNYIIKVYDMEDKETFICSETIKVLKE